MPRLFTSFHASRLAEMRGIHLRFAFDHVNYEKNVMDAIVTAKNVGLRRITIYVLVGYKDTPADALHRREVVKKQGAMPFAMRYQPLDATKKNAFVGSKWQPEQLSDFCRYWDCQAYLKNLPFEKFVYSYNPNQKNLFPLGGEGE